MEKIIILGHKNPDTDSIVSSLAAEDYFKKILKIGVKSCRAGELNNETKFVLKEFKVEAPLMVSALTGEEKVILVDHNELEQAVSNLKFSQIEKIIDHHKLSARTEKPIFCRVEPLGSTSSLLAKMYAESGKKIPFKIARLLAAGILSDTLNLTSPTSTKEDKKILDKLNKTAKINIKKFVKDLFAAKSSLEGISLKDIIDQDYKLFEMGKYKVGVGVWETTNPESVNSKKTEIIQALREQKTKEGMDYLFFMVVDIIKQESAMYVIGEAEKELAEKVFKEAVKNDFLTLKNVVSRKKQIIPPLTAELTK